MPFQTKVHCILQKRQANLTKTLPFETFSKGNISNFWQKQRFGFLLYQNLNSFYFHIYQQTQPQLKYRNTTTYLKGKMTFEMIKNKMQLNDICLSFFFKNNLIGFSHCIFRTISCAVDAFSFIPATFSRIDSSSNNTSVFN